MTVNDSITNIATKLITEDESGVQDWWKFIEIRGNSTGPEPLYFLDPFIPFIQPEIRIERKMLKEEIYFICSICRKRVRFCG